MKNLLATVTFIPSNQSGRSQPIVMDAHRCILSVNNLNFDCRVFFTDLPVSPGQTVDVEIGIIYSELALKHLQVGNVFVLREINTIARGVVREIYT